MATVKEIKKSIKVHQYVSDSISYVLSPENRNGDEKCFKASYLNCMNDGAESLSKQFYETRRAFNKDNNILAHHYVQSFSPNEKITPELAHQIGVELAEKIAPGFQVIVSTHIDKDHIHNHIIINAVSMETGLKWKGNGDTLNKSVRPESDKLCKKYGLTTIKKRSGLRGIDQSTRELAAKGKSWKVDLCKALDEAVKLCNSKDEFISFMKNKGFEITRYTDRHITFQKIGEKKKIRADTLAEQFGDYYKKENLEKLMGFYSIPKPIETTPKPKQQQIPFKNEFEKYEDSYFKKNPPPTTPIEAKTLQLLIKNSTTPFFFLLLTIMKLLLRRKNKQRLDRKYRLLHSKAKMQKQYKTKKPNLQETLERYETVPAIAGNIPYKNLIKAQGENYRVRIALSAVPKLYAYPFFFSASLYKSYALVTIKAKDRQLLQRALEIEDISVLEKHNEHYTAKAEYLALKKRAERLGVKTEFLVIQPERLSKLKEEKDRFVAIPTKEGKIRLAFLPQNKDFILHTLYPERYESNSDLFSVGRNSTVNTRLKSEALLGGQQMRYRTLTKEQVEQLAESTKGQELFAVFSKNAKGENLNGQYNIAFKEEDTALIESILQKPKTTKRKI
ncbi:MAG: relaxase/mobilization nuclease domain-containing protein [Clostridia bacterium]|nr:relaxase/mobilization nuclease domain-containing protein [Clostridia bacterium]